MKKHLYLILVLLVSFSCGTTKNTTKIKDNPVTISNEALEYEIIIMDNGFETYLLTRSKPMGYHSENYLEIKNQFYVSIWNSRVLNSLNYNPNIYESTINYDPNTHYGLEVNYKLYNYFKFVTYKYSEKF